MPSSYTEVRRRPPLPSTEVRRPLSIAGDSSYSSVSVAPYRPPQYSVRAGSLPPAGSASVTQARSRTSWAPAAGGPTSYGDFSTSSSWSQSTPRYQPRASSVPPLSASSLRSSAVTSYGGSVYRPRSRPYDPDLDDEDIISNSRSRYVPTNYTPRSRYLTGAGHRAALRVQSQSYYNDLQDNDDYSRTSLNELRAKTSQMMGTMDKHKQLIDRYRLQGATTNGPTTVGMSRDDIDRKYANIISNYRLDTTPTYRPGSSSTSSYTPAATTYTPPTSTGNKPEVSAARQKLRKLLSESKGNRNYYD
jgi:hypothetical protein